MKPNVEQWNTIQQDVLGDNDMINRQTLVDGINFGFGNIKANGCGPIAVYNLFKMAEKEANFIDIICEFEKHGTNFLEKLGTDPFYFKWFLERNDFGVKLILQRINLQKSDIKVMQLLWYMLVCTADIISLCITPVVVYFSVLIPMASISMENYVGELKNNIVFMFAINFLDFTKIWY